ncbi:RdgB/HAM1 family non-canonical purine NTP pyrophosphatase [Trueperella sp. LYQ143]|uniref:RdgB/HAM1 family non-canonical purine NTP pyrophosphatase n=1 Tax=Trueperella sp. LYQ143 TaxID=3391059 RepID=UPI0039831E2A
MIIFATRNPHKIDEVRRILASRWQQMFPQIAIHDVVQTVPEHIPDPIEDGVSFAENALIKARQIAGLCGQPALADDSGLCVQIMGGAPGIFSARWCGRHGEDVANMQLLLDQLRDVPMENRAARFTCAAAFVTPDGEEIVRYGYMDGVLRYQPAGENGFGYDPIFQPEGYAVTCAELSAEQKNAISHRQQAFAALADDVSTWLQANGMV